MERKDKKIYVRLFSGLMCGGLILYGLVASAQEIHVSARLDTGTIVLGDQTILRLRADIPAESRIHFPQLADTLSARIPIVEVAVPDTQRTEPGRWIVTQAYTITSFDAGMQVIPAFDFVAGDSTWQTDPLPLQVEAVAVDTTKAIYDIKQPLEVSYGWLDRLKDNLLWVLLGGAVLLLSAGLWIWLKKRKKKEVVPITEPDSGMPPHELALGKLQALREKKLWQQGEVKRYHSELSDIVRAFLESRYGIPAMEQTTDEIFSSLAAREIPEQHKTLLKQVLTLADLVKFAKEQPVHTDNEQSMDRAIAFIKEVAV